MEDNYQHKGMRKRLIDGIRSKGINNENVLNALYAVPRHVFLDSAFLELSYEDRALPIACGQTISQPYTVAFQTHLLNVQKYEKILEIGTGSGYQTCVLCELGAKVYTIERKYELYKKAQQQLSSIGYTANFYYGDGYQGLPEFCPFDKILITAGAPFVPDDLKKQLKIGGVLVAPIGNTSVQIMTCVVRISLNEFKTIEFDEFVFVPMLPGKD